MAAVENTLTVVTAPSAPSIVRSVQQWHHGPDCDQMLKCVSDPLAEAIEPVPQLGKKLFKSVAEERSPDALSSPTIAAEID